MAGLELRFLGDFEVRRNGRSLPLPPSKKTRALLAFLSLQPRRFRRERLCELLWEVPDDPRGSLRWSLSKLRRLVDDGKRKRIVADRSSVAVDADGVAIDVRELRALVTADLATASVEELEAAAVRYRGNFLEGLDFSNFHDFHAWCVAEREHALRDRAALLSELIRRLADEPARALAHARALVGLSPYDEGHRATLIRLLHAARQPGEAEEQYRLGLRMLEEAGIAASGVLHAARRTPRIDRPPVAAVEAPLPAAGASRPRTQGLFGREQETGIIAAELARVQRDRTASVLLLRGAPGIGKTRVLEHVLAQAAGSEAFVLQAAAFESDAIRPFALWIDALRALAGNVHDTVFGDADLANRDRLFTRLSDLVAKESADRPVVLLFDDVHWCDESSAAALHYVMRRNRDRPFLGIVAARDDELRDNVPAQQALRGLRRDGLLGEIDIGPLPAAALSSLIDQQAPGADSERLGRACGGNPLLAIELARAEVSGSAGGSLNDLVRERLARYGVVGAEVLRWAALLSPSIDVGKLVEVSGLSAGEVGAALENAERHAMLRAGDRGLSFVHDLIARAVYADISPLRRQIMHRRLAELLEADAAQDLARAADLAHHATQSRDAALGARAMVSAGRLCLRFFANDDALSLARRGLQFAKQLSDAERARLDVELHEILLSAGPLDDWEAAAGKYAALAERALDHGAVAHARLGYHMASYVRWAQGHWKEAREQTLQAVRAVRGGDDEAHVVGMAETAKCLVMIERDLSQADAMLMEASALAARRGFSHHAIAAGLGMLRFHENRLDEAEELFREALTLCKSDGDRLSEFQANEYLAMLDFQRRRVPDARARCEELAKLGEKLREGSEEPFAHAMLGLCAYALDGDAAELDAALAELRIADAKHRLAYILTRAAVIDCDRALFERAAERASEALDYATVLERASEMLIANAVLSRCRAEAGRGQEAAVLAQEVDRLGSAGAALWAGDLAAAVMRANECEARVETG